MNAITNYKVPGLKINNTDSEYICEFSECGKYLKEPITLACGDMICKHHVDDNTTTLRCPICKEDFIVPEEGFRINRKMNEILIKNSHLTGKHKEVKSTFDQLEIAIEKFRKSNLSKPDLFIHDYFSQIRNKVDIHREQMIDNIHKRSEHILNRLSQLEQECYQNQARKENLHFQEAEVNELNELREKLRLPRQQYKRNDFTHLCDKIKKIKFHFEENTKTFENQLINKIVTFKPHDSQSFGELIIETKKLPLQITNDSGKLVKTITCHSDKVKCLYLDQKSNTLFTGSSDKTIKVWSIEKNEFKLAKTLSGHTKSVSALLVFRDQKLLGVQQSGLLISSSFNELKAWNMENDFECVQTLKETTVCICLVSSNILVCGLVKIISNQS
jgi:WD40 repeat protein